MRIPRFLPLAAAVHCVSAAYTLPPALQAAQDSANGTVAIPSILTDTSKIIETVGVINQKAGAPSDGTLPGLPQAPTVLTALDGEITVSKVPDANSTTDAPHGAGRRGVSDYKLVFYGTATHDAAVEGTAYLTFNVVTNSSYSMGLAECLTFCDRTTGCVFVNLYYEFNNPLLDFGFSEKSNLKCVLYADVHTSSEKTNYGGQQLSPPPAPPTFIEYSSGYASIMVSEPAVPEGYELVFGPSSAANIASGYMGFALLDRYDPSACAKLCNQREPDPDSGACKYFNIWRALVSGVPTTYTCALYSVPTDASTATNLGQGPLAVTFSRGYARISHIPDGGFEAFACVHDDDFCFAEQVPGWIGTSPSGGQYDATVFHYAPYAHKGAGVGLLGCAMGSDHQSGTLRPAGALAGLLPGRAYVVQLFHSSTYSGAELERPAFVELVWNGVLAGSVRVGFSPWTYFEFNVIAVGGGNDTLLLTGGKAPAYDFIDDIYLFLV
ncbi:hypothetical protein B0H15DRAFT_883757 [Mycena belliarum]|uniref:Fruit-body specific protein a n=1 Tax=Mycena belliarum TaxID=1033014 RepID=A0AAD6U604_9AGAR|nr:hypothetical protein B0H15DRAFT_883757 [Mycena belliae]